MNNSERIYFSKFAVDHDPEFIDFEDFDDFYFEDGDEINKLTGKINLDVDDDFLFEQ